MCAACSLEFLITQRVALAVNAPSYAETGIRYKIVNFRERQLLRFRGFQERPGDRMLTALLEACRDS